MRKIDGVFDTVDIDNQAKTIFSKDELWDQQSGGHVKSSYQIYKKKQKQNK